MLFFFFVFCFADLLFFEVFAHLLSRRFGCFCYSAFCNLSLCFSTFCVFCLVACELSFVVCLLLSVE